MTVSLNDYKDISIAKSFKEVQEQEMLEKAQRAGLTRKVITDKRGKKTTVWVTEPKAEDKITDKQELDLIHKYNATIAEYEKIGERTRSLKEIKQDLDKIEGQVPMKTRWALRNKRRRTTIGM